MAPSSPWTRPCSCPLARRSRLALSRARASEATSPCAAACNCRITWAARAPSPWPVRRSRRPGAAGRRCPAPADARRRRLGASLPPTLLAPPPVRRIRVIYGPHGAPEYFTAGYIETFFAAQWEVHFNSSRTGVRLIGPRLRMGPRQRREAGLHPSNIHDNPYAVGPWISRGHAGDPGTRWSEPGGFRCPVTVIEADLWQLGQLKAGDRVQFIAVDLPTARRLADARDQESATLTLTNRTGKPRPLPRRSCSTRAPATSAWWPACRATPICCSKWARPNWTSSRASGRTPSCGPAGAGYRWHRRPDARHPLAAGPLLPAQAAAAGVAAGHRGAMGARQRRPRPERALPHRAPAAVLGRSGLPARPSTNT